jgi:hypothetical protein
MLCGAWRSRTMWFSGFLALLGAVSDNLPIIQQYIDPKTYSLSLFVIAIVLAYLRATTTKSLEDK